MSKKINLSYAFHPGMFKYPSDIEPDIQIIPAKYVSGGKSKSGKVNLNITNHHGTHIDYPAHKIPNGKTSDNYKPEKYFNKCALIDLASSDLSKKREMTLEDIIKNFNPEDYKDLGALIVYTGFCDEMSKNEGKLSGQAKTDFEGKFPYLSQEAADYLAEKMPNLNIIAIDSFAVDKQGSNSEVHKKFFSNDTLILETLVNLKELKEELKRTEKKEFKLYSITLDIKNADASPARAYAVIE